MSKGPARHRARLEETPQPPDIRIEFPSRGQTYWRQVYGVYLYDYYPRGSVFEGRERRRFLDSFETLEEARKQYPEATEVQGSCYKAPDVSHLPDDEG